MSDCSVIKKQTAVEEIEQPDLTTSEVEKIEQIIRSMNYKEKSVVAKQIPTEIMQAEITRRLNRDKQKMEALKNILFDTDIF